MNNLNNFKILIICIFLLGAWQPVYSSVRNTIPDVEAQWRAYLANDAEKSPLIQFPFERCFKSAAQTNNLPLSLLVAVARGESNFNPDAKSNRNCHGLMQIQWPKTAKHLGIYRLNALYDPCTNIRAGAKYLRELLDRYDGNMHLALAAYNYGPHRISKNSAGAGSIPEGARWYSSYIFHHLQRVLHAASVTAGFSVSAKGSVYSREKRLAIITFNQPYRAAGFYQHLLKQAPGLNLDWYRIGLGRYQVVMLYSDQKSLENGKRKLRNLGVGVK